MQFAQVFRGGAPVHWKNFTLRIQKSTRRETRYSVVVSKKSVRTAVKRHRIRRQSYAVLHELLEGVEASFRVIIFARSGVTTLSYTELKNEIRTLFQRAGTRDS